MFMVQMNRSFLLMDFENTSKISYLLDNWKYSLNLSSLRAFNFKNVLK